MNPDAFSTLVLLGTARLKEPPAAPLPVLEPAWAALDWSRQPEITVLSGCALRAAATGAGRIPPSGFAEETPCEPETRPVAPEAAASVLRRILEGEAPECLEEWLELCLEKGCIVPPRALPSLFERAVRSRALRPAVAAVAGNRGAWLARREDLEDLLPAPAPAAAVSAADPPPDEETWENGILVERVFWLRAMRQADPVRAAAALAAVWPQEPGESRMAFLNVIGNNPTDEELPLLEIAAVKDRRREVRQQARQALMSRPGSQFTKRAFDRAAALLRLERGSSGPCLILELPEKFDPEWKEDGIEEKPPAVLKSMGAKAFHALQLISPVPLSLWTAHFGVDAAKLMELNQDPDSARVILLGWLNAAQAHPEPESAKALALHLAGLKKWPHDAPPPVPALLRLISVLPDSEASAVVLAAESGILRQGAPGQLITASRFPVPAGDTADWVAVILAWLKSQPWMSHQTAPIRQLAQRFPLAGLSQALRLISLESSLGGLAETFASVLEFRQQLHASFQPPPRRDRAV